MLVIGSSQRLNLLRRWLFECVGEVSWGVTNFFHHTVSKAIPMDEKNLSEAGKAILDASRDSIPVSFGRGVIGAAIGGAIGWFAFGWLLSQGFYALALPGALVGLGFSMLSRRSMLIGGLFCAVAGFALMVLCEWNHRAFSDDDSLLYFVTHLHQLDKQLTYLLLAVGTIIAFWFGKGR